MNGPKLKIDVLPLGTQDFAFSCACFKACDEKIVGLLIGFELHPFSDLNGFIFGKNPVFVQDKISDFRGGRFRGR